jgi:hypothetical protein
MNNNPIWRTPSFFRGVGSTTNQICNIWGVPQMDPQARWMVFMENPKIGVPPFSETPIYLYSIYIYNTHYTTPSSNMEPQKWGSNFDDFSTILRKHWHWTAWTAARSSFRSGLWSTDCVTAQVFVKRWHRGTFCPWATAVVSAWRVSWMDKGMELPS